MDLCPWIMHESDWTRCKLAFGALKNAYELLSPEAALTFYTETLSQLSEDEMICIPDHIVMLFLRVCPVLDHGTPEQVDFFLKKAPKFLQCFRYGERLMGKLFKEIVACMVNTKVCARVPGFMYHLFYSEYWLENNGHANPNSHANPICKIKLRDGAILSIDYLLGQGLTFWDTPLSSLLLPGSNFCVRLDFRVKRWLNCFAIQARVARELDRALTSKDGSAPPPSYVTNNPTLFLMLHCMSNLACSFDWLEPNRESVFDDLVYSLDIVEKHTRQLSDAPFDNLLSVSMSFLPPEKRHDMSCCLQKRVIATALRCAIDFKCDQTAFAMELVSRLASFGPASYNLPARGPGVDTLIGDICLSRTNLSYAERIPQKYGWEGCALFKRLKEGGGAPARLPYMVIPHDASVLSILTNPRLFEASGAFQSEYRENMVRLLMPILRLEFFLLRLYLKKEDDGSCSLLPNEMYDLVWVTYLKACGLDTATKSICSPFCRCKPQCAYCQSMKRGPRYDIKTERYQKTGQASRGRHANRPPKRRAAPLAASYRRPSSRM